VSFDPLGGDLDSGCYGERGSYEGRPSPSLVVRPAGAGAPAAARAASPGAGDAGVVKEKISASSDSDTSTRQTVAKMCEYIRAGVDDDVVRQWAAKAVHVFAGPNPDPRMVVWAVFWMLKHSVKYVHDEPRLFRIGEPGALDLLIAPAVLVREPEPKEDCDGFTMLACALLRILGLRAYIVTVAADPSDPRRWSHVFAVAQLPDGLLVPVDGSHGEYPGWMVPASHTFRRQAWNLDGRPVELSFAPSAMHGYRRRSGLSGCYVGMIDEATGDTVASCGDGGGGGGSDSQSISFPFVTGGGGGGGAISKPIDWGSIFSNAISTAGKVAQTAFLPSGVTTRLANGQIVSNTGAYGAQYLSPSPTSSLLPILGIGLAVVLVMAVSGRKS